MSGLLTKETIKMLIPSVFFTIITALGIFGMEPALESFVLAINKSDAELSKIDILLINGHELLQTHPNYNEFNSLFASIILAFFLISSAIRNISKIGFWIFILITSGSIFFIHIFMTYRMFTIL